VHVKEERLSAAERYLDLLKRCLTRSLYDQQYEQIKTPAGLLPAPVRHVIRRQPFRLVRAVSAKQQESGEYWPAEAETMIGMTGLDAIQGLARDVLVENVPGDLIETGVWRGGAAIFMRAVLDAYEDSERRVWVADSFEGLPVPRYSQDAGDIHWALGGLDVSLEAVKANFARYGLLDERVCFLPGWFRETLPSASIERLALMRLD
jgi:O-methyltransferase